ncbi:MAG: hypothetical protein HQM06_11750 [Magnetococcales bacterium]|nr:hypothetical protein [Magnetococcales bacterium]
MDFADGKIVAEYNDEGQKGDDMLLSTTEITLHKMDIHPSAAIVTQEFGLLPEKSEQDQAPGKNPSPIEKLLARIGVKEAPRIASTRCSVTRGDGQSRTPEGVRR